MCVRAGDDGGEAMEDVPDVEPERPVGLRPGDGAQIVKNKILGIN